MRVARVLSSAGRRRGSFRSHWVTTYRQTGAHIERIAKRAVLSGKLEAPGDVGAPARKHSGGRGLATDIRGESRSLKPAHRGGMASNLPVGYEHGTTRAYRYCRPACNACRTANAAAAAARRAAKLETGMPAGAHGKPSGYTFWSCRCRACRKAWKQSQEGRSRAVRKKPDLSTMPSAEHGTKRGYDYWGCRCEDCRLIAARARAEVKAGKRAEHEGPTVVRRYKYRIYPGPSAVAGLRQVFGGCRFVYNSYIALARDRYETGGRHPSAYDATKILVTQARRAPETAWLASVPSAPLSAAVHDAAAAYDRFFDSIAGRRKGRPVGRPKFKSRKTAKKAARFPEGSFTIRGGWQNTGKSGGKLHLATIAAEVRVNWHRPLPGYASAATVREDPDGRFWVSFVVRVPVAPPKTPTRGARVAGVDLGIASYAAIAYSDGTREKVTNPDFFDNAAAGLRRADKGLARKQPGSRNYEKAKRQRARRYTRLANQRANHARQVASKLSRENQTVVIEDLDVAGMASSTRSSRRRRRNIHDVGWAQFRSALAQACARKGVELIVAPRYFASTQICPICHNNGGPKDTEIRTWTCEWCRTELDRDYSAAVNLLLIAAGSAVDACGRDVRLRLAGAVSDEAGSHRNGVRASASRRRKRARQTHVGGRVQASSRSAENQGSAALPGKSGGLARKARQSPSREPLSHKGSEIS